MSSVDVIVPCYRYGHFLQECVASVLTQEDVAVRVLIIDDASPDDSAQVAARIAHGDSRITFLPHAANKGHIATYNEGIEWASADYVLLLSADDYLLPGALSRATAFMDAHPEVGFTFGKAIELGVSGVKNEVTTAANLPSKTGTRTLSGIRFIEISGPHNIVPTPTAVVRTCLQKEVGGYRPELPHSGDMEMWLRLAAHASVGVLEAHQAVYRRHSANMSSAYVEDFHLPDLQQRRHALQCFLLSCEHALPNARAVHSQLLKSLSREAVGFASAAFNAGEMDASNQLMQLAAEMWPGVSRSLPSLKLSLKRNLGLKGWRAVERVLRMAPARRRS